MSGGGDIKRRSTFVNSYGDWVSDVNRGESLKISIRRPKFIDSVLYAQRRNARVMDSVAADIRLGQQLCENGEVIIPFSEQDETW